jgi:hypothetical protein
MADNITPCSYDPLVQALKDTADGAARGENSPAMNGLSLPTSFWCLS